MAEMVVEIKVSDMEPIKELIDLMAEHFEDLPEQVKNKLEEICED